MLTGSMVALVTPFRKGRVDEKALRSLIEFQIQGGTSAIVPCGTTGESATLSHSEHNHVIELTVKAVRGRVPVMAGTGSNSTAEAIALTKHAKKVGVNLIFKILADIARVTGDDYDVEILEVHHRFKKDAPSGTAMARVLADALKRDLEEACVYSRAGLVGERKKKEIGIQSLRAGDVG